MKTIPEEVQVLEDGILFKFLENISAKTFDNTTSWGFEIKNAADDIKRPRWGQALRIGPNVTEVKEGQYILIEKLQWTTGLEYRGDKFWKTNQTQVIMTSNEVPKEF